MEPGKPTYRVPASGLPAASVSATPSSASVAAAAAATTTATRGDVQPSKTAFTLGGKPYQRLQLIGRGASSKVFLVLSESDGRLLAMKKVRLRGQDPHVVQSYRNETELLSRLACHERIIRLVHVYEDVAAQTLYILLEYGEIDLAHLLAKEERHGLLSMNFVRLYWEHMLLAVHALHEANVIHSDLKPANFLLVQGSLKLIDFGISKAIATDTTNIHRENQTGTINYMPPEAMTWVEGPAGTASRRVTLGRASDVWSLGCILYQMVFGRPPFAHIEPILTRLQCIVNPQYRINLTLPPTAAQSGGLDPLLRDVIERCLVHRAADRATIPALLAHPFLSPEKYLRPEMMAQPRPSSSSSSSS